MIIWAVLVASSTTGACCLVEGVRNVAASSHLSGPAASPNFLTRFITPKSNMVDAFIKTNVLFEEPEVIFDGSDSTKKGEVEEIVGSLNLGLSTPNGESNYNEPMKFKLIYWNGCHATQAIQQD